MIVLTVSFMTDFSVECFVRNISYFYYGPVYFTMVYSLRLVRDAVDCKGISGWPHEGQIIQTMLLFYIDLYVLEVMLQTPVLLHLNYAY